MLEFMQARNSGLLAADMGTGKTLAALQYIKDQFDSNTYGRLAVVVTKKRIMRTWEDEILTHTTGTNYIILDHNSIPVALKELQKWVDQCKHRSGIIIVNYEKMINDKLFETIKHLGPTILILDEGHKVKAAGSKISRMLYDLGKRVPKKFILTGTPMANGPMDIYGQARFLKDDLFTVPYPKPDSPKVRLGTNYNKFEDHFTHRMPITGTPVYKILGYRNQELFNSILNDFMYRVTADEVLDLPESVYTRVHVTMPPAARKIYTELVDEMITEFDGGILTVDNVLARTTRLRQITGGYFINNAGQHREIYNEKLQALVEIVEGISDQPFIVMASYTDEIGAIRHWLEAIGITTSELSGKEDTLKEWQAGNTQAIVVQPQAGSEGVSLVRSKYIIYYSIGYDNAQYLQSKARIRRPGQANSTVYYYFIVCKNSIDLAILNALQSKNAASEAVLSHIKGYKK